MSGFFAFGGSSPTAPNDTYEPLGYGTDGSLTAVSTTANNTKGSYTSFGTTANAWCGFFLDIGLASAAGRFLVDISINGGTSVAISNLPLLITTTANHRIYIPLAVPASSGISIRMASNPTTLSIRLAVSGRILTANTPAGYSTCTEMMPADTTNTRPQAISIPLQASLSTWTQLVASTAATYGALLVSAAENAALAAATSQQAMIELATGAAASEVEIARSTNLLTNVTPYVQRHNRLYERSIPSGTRLSAAAIAATPGSDALRIALHGFA